MDERRKHMQLSDEDKEWIEGLIVKSHDGRVQSFSAMFQDLKKTVENHGAKITELEDALKPIIDAASAGKLSYMFILKFIGLISAVGGMILLFKQLWK